MQVARFHGFKPTIEIVMSVLVVLVTMFHAVAYALSSYTASSTAAKAWWMILGYQGVVAVILAVYAYVDYSRSGRYVEMSARSITEAIENCGKLLPVLLTLCCVGFVLHAYSKLALVNFHLSNCIGELRNAWITTPHDQIPAFRRFTSIVGHLLSSFAYMGLFFSVYRYSIGLRKAASFLFASVFFLLGVGYAFFIGSQNVVLAHFVVAALAIGLSAASTPVFWRGWTRKLVIFGWLAAAAVFFSVSVFNNRVHCGGGAPSVQAFQHYEENFFDEIPMRKKETVTEFNSKVRQACDACNAIFIYLNHGIYNFQHIVAQGDLRGDPVSFNFFKGVAKRLGFPMREKSSKQRVFGLGGVTLPGSAYHDFGFSGLIYIGIAQILMVVAAGYMLRSGSIHWEGVGFVLYIVAGFVTALSLMFVGLNVIAFPFVAWSAIATIAGIITWKKFHDKRVHMESIDMLRASRVDPHGSSSNVNPATGKILEK